MSKAALGEMCRLQEIEQQYPIKIEEYLRTEVIFIVAHKCIYLCRFLEIY